jgi:hypothetical protein
LLARQPRFIGEFRDRRGIGEIELIFLNGGKGAAQIALGILAGLDRRDHDAIGHRSPKTDRPAPPACDLP